jgi:hypothetical protein
MATIRKRNGKFQVQVRRDGHQSHSRTFHTLADAKEWARKAEVQADRGELGASRKVLSNVTLGDLVTRYINEVVPRKRGAFEEGVFLRAFLRHPICRKSMASLTTACVSACNFDPLMRGIGVQF